jgi:hypothetical protein
VNACLRIVEDWSSFRHASVAHGADDLRNAVGHGGFFSITRILRLLRESEVARLPAATEADVTFNQAGSDVLPISCQCQRLPWAMAPIIASNNVTTAPPFLPACRWNVARNIMTATMLAI